MTPEQLARALAMKPPGGESSLEALDDREMEVFSILSQGYSSGQIESEFHIKPGELKRLKGSIQRKLGLKNEVQLLQAAVLQARSRGD
jgi:DNA-binding CsgD family transcriptional regulator